MKIRDILQIAAFAPKYADGKGQGLEVYSRNGTMVWQGISLLTAIFGCALF